MNVSRNMAGVALAATLLVGLGACAELGLAGPPGEQMGRLIGSAIEENARDGESSVDFSEVVDGEWTRMIVVCGGGESDLEVLLGFKWEEMPELDSPGFLSLGIFADEEHVLASFQTGLDDGWVDHWQFTFCGDPQADPGSQWATDLQFELSRTEAVLTFRSENFLDSHYWYVPSEVLAEFAPGS